MVSVISNPTGHNIIDQAIDAVITGSAGDALVTFPYHGLGTGDYVYITSDIDEYAGFWYVTAIDTDTFKISEHATAAFVEFYQDADVEYYQTNEHVWSSIFLPIMYKASNDLWPVNSVDDELTISSVSDDNGYSDMTLSGAIRATVNALEYVKISGAADALNGVWQIVEAISTSNLVINLPYSASNDFSAATIQYYYNNYQVSVKVYAGLPASHPWEAKKPYVEVAQLDLTPDENNEVMFSVANYIKEKVAIKNNTTIFSFPLNLDAFTGFYIATAESYDTSDNYSLSSLSTEGESDKELLSNTEFDDTSVWTQTGASAYSWVITGGAATLSLPSGTSKKLTQIIPVGSLAGDYVFTSERTISNCAFGVDSMNIFVYFYDDDDNLISSTIDFASADGTSTLNKSFTSLVPIRKVEIFCEINSGVNIDISIPFARMTGPFGKSYVDDSFNGFAVAGKLPFKNVYAGQYSDYVYTDGSPALWLTLLTRLLAVEDKYFDVSFIKNLSGAFFVTIDQYIADYLAYTEDIAYADQGIGVYRIPITANANYDYFCIRVVAASEEVLTLSTFANNPGDGTDWTTGASPSVTQGSVGTTDILFKAYGFTLGVTYIITFVITSDSAVAIQVFGRIYDNSFVQQHSENVSFAIATTKTISLSFTATADDTQIGVLATWFANSAATITVDSITVGSSDTQITEEICIDMVESCEVQTGVLPDDIRLLEDGDFRILE